MTARNSLNFTIMARVVAAAMVPPLALSLATVVRGSLFTPAERTYGRAAWLFGPAFVPESAIPFALAAPLRVIPASMAGGAVTGALTMNFGSILTVSYGGVFAAGHFGKPLLFAAAVAAGVLTTAAVAIGLKGLRRTAPAASTARAATTGTPRRPWRPAEPDRSTGPARATAPYRRLEEERRRPQGRAQGPARSLIHARKGVRRDRRPARPTPTVRPARGAGIGAGNPGRARRPHNTRPLTVLTPSRPRKPPPPERSR
ncbi:hypothetical protein PV750_11325 [Streptomyces europaeiscabiei]|nr:hypothetical protein [Streptomyces europaeiscabiei]